MIKNKTRNLEYGIYTFSLTMNIEKTLLLLPFKITK